MNKEKKNVVYDYLRLKKDLPFNSITNALASPIKALASASALASSVVLNLLATAST